MPSVSAQAPGGRDRHVTAVLLAFAILPVIVFVVVRYLGFMSMARLAAIGVVGLGIGLAFYLRPRYGVYFMLFYFYSGLSFYIRQGPAIMLPKAALLVVLVGMAIEMMRGRRSWQPVDPVFMWSVSLLGIIALQSMLWAYDIPRSVVDFSIFLKSLFFVLLIVQLIRTPDDLKWFGRWVFLGALGTILLGLLNWMLGIDIHVHAIQARFTRFEGAHDDPNFAAAFMTSAIPMGVFAVRSSRSIHWRLLSTLGVVVLIVGVFTTYSRAALIAFTFVALAVLFREVRSRKAALIMFTVLVVGILLTPRYYWVRVMSLAEIAESVRGDFSLNMRLRALHTGWEMFKDHPLTGIGLKNFSIRSDYMLFTRMVAHNSYLEILCGLGIFGLLAYLTVCYSALRTCVAGMRAKWSKQYEWLGGFSYYMMVSLLAVMISAMFLSIEFNYLIWVPLGGALALTNAIPAKSRD